MIFPSVWPPVRKNRLLRRLIIIAACVLLGGHLLLTGLGRVSPLDPLGDVLQQPDPVLTAERLRHIVDGDARGGGHLHGLNRPCKSEFPASWTRETIAREIPLIAANDNLTWQHSRNGYVTADTTTADGLRLRIVVDPRDNEIITAYPTNVTRNPCPANDR